MCPSFSYKRWPFLDILGTREVPQDTKIKFSMKLNFTAPKKASDTLLEGTWVQDGHELENMLIFFLKNMALFGHFTDYGGPPGYKIQIFDETDIQNLKKGFWYSFGRYMGAGWS